MSITRCALTAGASVFLLVIFSSTYVFAACATGATAPCTTTTTRVAPAKPSTAPNTGAGLNTECKKYLGTFLKVAPEHASKLNEGGFQDACMTDTTKVTCVAASGRTEVSVPAIILRPSTIVSQLSSMLAGTAKPKTSPIMIDGKPSASPMRKPLPRVRVTAACAGDVVTVKLGTSEVKCKIADLKKHPVVFIETEVNAGSTTQSAGAWKGYCNEEDAKKHKINTQSTQQNLDPTKANKAKDAEEFNKNLKDKPGELQRLDTEHGVIVAKCDAEGKCTMQAFKKDEKGNLIPGKVITDGVSPESIKLATESLAGENGKKNFDTLFNAKGCTGPTCATTTQPCTGTNCAATNQPNNSFTPNNGNNQNNSGFKPTNSSGEQKKPQGGQGGGGQQQQPQQPQQNQFANSPAPYCASVTSNKQEITVGESAVIQWNIPYAIRFEIRGGTAAINGSSAVVRPTETTSYSVVGYGIPGAGQQQQFGQSSFGVNSQASGAFDQGAYGQSTQFGAPQSQGSCGISGAACCQPVTIVVNPKPVKVPKDVIVEDEEDVTLDFASEKADIKCAPKDMEVGKSASIVWSCPDGAERSTTIAQHTDGTVLASRESFYGEGKTSGSKKVYPESDTNYTVRCINKKGKRTIPASCTVRVVEPKKKTSNSTYTTGSSSIGGMSLSITASAKTIKARTEEVTISWKSAGAETCGVIGPNGYKQDNTKSGTVSGTSEESGIITFAFTCKAGGVQKTQKVSVQVLE